MATDQTFDTREPDLFAAGDSLCFRRWLRDFLPSNGWSLLYDLIGEDGTPATSFTSVAVGDFHQVQQDDFGAALEAGQYVLTGYAVNTNGERHRIYYGNLNLSPNFSSGQPAAAPLTTHAQRMIQLIEAQLERLAVHELDATTVQQSQLIRVKRESLERQLAINKEIRFNEVSMERVRNGLPSGAHMTARFGIIGV